MSILGAALRIAASNARHSQRMRKIAQLQCDLDPSDGSELTICLLLKRRSGGGCVERYGHVSTIARGASARLAGAYETFSVRWECGFRRELDYAIGILGFERFEVLPKRRDIAAKF